MPFKPLFKQHQFFQYFPTIRKSCLKVLSLHISAQINLQFLLLQAEKIGKLFLK